MVRAGLVLDVLHLLRRCGRDVRRLPGDRRVGDVQRVLLREQGVLARVVPQRRQPPLPLARVAGLQVPDGLGLVALQDLERLVRQTTREELGRRAEQSVAVLDVRVEEGEWAARLHGLDPQGDLGEFHGHRVEVDAVHAAGDDLAQGVTHGLGGRLRIVGLDLREPAGDAAGRRDQEVAAAASRVTHGQGEQRRPALVLRRARADGPLDDRVEGRVQEAVDERRGRVVGAGGLAVVAVQLPQDVGAVVVLAGFEFEERLVDRAEFVRAQVPVVDLAGPAELGVEDDGEGTHRLVQGLVGEGETVQPPIHGGGLEEAAEGGQPQFRPSAGRTEALDDEGEGLPLVAVRAAGAAGEAAQAVRGEVLLVPVACGFVGVRVEEQSAVLGDEEEEQPVDEPQQGRVEVADGEGAGAQGLAQLRVVGVGDEPGADHAEGRLDTLAKLLESAGAGVDGLGAPLLQRAGGDGGALEAGAVQQAPQEDEVVGAFALEDRLEVELDESGAGERGGLAQQPQLAAVGQDTPQGLVAGAIEVLLNHGLRGLRRHVGGAGVQRDVPAGEVHGHVRPRVTDREVLRLVVGGQAGLRHGRQRAEAELFEQGQQPAFDGEPHRVHTGIVVRSVAGKRVLVGGPHAAQIAPGALGGVPYRLALGEQPVVGGLRAGLLLALLDTDEEVVRQQSADRGDGVGDQRPGSGHASAPR
ncbi:hypothetical protein SCANM63S_00615 [Streptomyces canarius]